MISLVLLLSKFYDIYKRASSLKGIKICALGCHIGSQILEPRLFAEAAQVLAHLLKQLKGGRFST